MAQDTDHIGHKSIHISRKAKRTTKAWAEAWAEGNPIESVGKRTTGKLDQHTPVLSHDQDFSRYPVYGQRHGGVSGWALTNINVKRSGESTCG